MPGAAEILTTAPAGCAVIRRTEKLPCLNRADEIAPKVNTGLQWRPSTSRDNDVLLTADDDRPRMRLRPDHLPTATVDESLALQWALQHRREEVLLEVERRVSR
jgi:hypothetical protein